MWPAQASGRSIKATRSQNMGGRKAPCGITAEEKITCPRLLNSPKATGSLLQSPNGSQIACHWGCARRLWNGWNVPCQEPFELLVYICFQSLVHTWISIVSSNKCDIWHGIFISVCARFYSLKCLGMWIESFWYFLLMDYCGRTCSVNTYLMS